MKKLIQFIVCIALGVLLGASGAYFLRETPKDPPPILTGPARYTCQLSGGTFQNGRCNCPLEIEGQTQETMYDPNTGFCQSTAGGPNGDAFAVSTGLPYGEYAFWIPVISNLCENSGGTTSGAACVCPPKKTYKETSGKCE